MRYTAKFDHSTIEYVATVYPVTINFPKEKIICDLCPFCHTENGGTRFRCTETAEILPYHNLGIGIRCPLGINLKNNEEDCNNE